MTRQCLYLLRNRKDNAFKIGVSAVPARRGRGLPQPIDWHQSLKIPMDGGDAFKVEKLVHYLFREHGVPMPRCDGYTEWFAIEASDDVLAFLAHQQIRLGIGEPEPAFRPAVYAATASRIEGVRHHNRNTVAWLRDFLMAADAFNGGAVEVRISESERSFGAAGVMSVAGDDAGTLHRFASTVSRSSMYEIGRSKRGRPIFGLGSIFSMSFFSPPDAPPRTELCVRDEYLALAAPPCGTVIPALEHVKGLLMPRVAR